MPARARLSVRGIGVADRVRTSTARAELLEAFLGGHAEALFLVDHDEAEVAEVDVLAEQAMGADDEVDAAVGQPGDRPFLLGRRHEPGEEADLDAGTPRTAG